MSLRKRFHAWLLSRATVRYDATVNRYKVELFAGIKGMVVEIGPGPGSNLKYYPKDITLVGIEPNIFMHRYFDAEARKLGLQNMKLITASAEHIPLKDNVADAVVSTLVLCSVADPGRVLEEVRRVLKPGGKFIFLEHVAARKKSPLYLAQKIFKPFWKLIADGCNPDRETLTSINKAGFEKISAVPLKIGKSIISPHIAGVALK